jgi:hypothetical protein
MDMVSLDFEFLGNFEVIVEIALRIETGARWGSIDKIIFKI